jgi:hypothetical protein
MPKKHHFWGSVIDKVQGVPRNPQKHTRKKVPQKYLGLVGSLEVNQIDGASMEEAVHKGKGGRKGEAAAWR